MAHHFKGSRKKLKFWMLDKFLPKQPVKTLMQSLYLYKPNILGQNEQHDNDMNVTPKEKVESLD